MKLKFKDDALYLAGLKFARAFALSLYEIDNPQDVEREIDDGLKVIRKVILDNVDEIQLTISDGGKV